MQVPARTEAREGAKSILHGVPSASLSQCCAEKCPEFNTHLTLVTICLWGSFSLFPSIRSWAGLEMAHLRSFPFLYLWQSVCTEFFLAACRQSFRILPKAVLLTATTSPSESSLTLASVNQLRTTRSLRFPLA